MTKIKNPAKKAGQLVEIMSRDYGLSDSLLLLSIAADMLVAAIASQTGRSTGQIILDVANESINAQDQEKVEIYLQDLPEDARQPDVCEGCALESDCPARVAVFDGTRDGPVMPGCRTKKVSS